MHPSFRLHEICCRLIDSLLAHTGHVHGKNPNPYPGILFAPVCLFEILLTRLAHDMAGINGSASLSIGGLNLERASACSYTHTILDVIVDDKVQLFICKIIILGQHSIDFFYNRFGFLNFK